MQPAMIELVPFAMRKTHPYVAMTADCQQRKLRPGISNDQLEPSRQREDLLGEPPHLPDPQSKLYNKVQ